MELTEKQRKKLADTVTKALNLARMKYGFNRIVDGYKIAEVLKIYNSYIEYEGVEQEKLNVNHLANAFGQIELLCQHIDKQKKLKLENGKSLEFTELGGKLIGSVIW